MSRHVLREPGSVRFELPSEPCVIGVIVRAVSGLAFWSDADDLVDGMYARDGLIEPTVDAQAWCWVRVGPDQWLRQVFSADHRRIPRWDGLLNVRWGGLLAQTGGVEVIGFACRSCGRISWSPADGEHGYCGACSAWTGEEG